ncbi:MAG: triose-phosphate isomerase [candidate division WOR-3 bacterium]|nr:triose-phosphate isomerase [candidate division WOR-3 bacterium]
MRKLLIGGNWKMHKGIKETEEFSKVLLNKEIKTEGIDVFIAPPFTSIPTAVEIFKDTGISIGAQNLFWEEEGAYTGEVSSLFLKELGVKWVIIGHSERRNYFFETNEKVRKKVKKALQKDLNVVICIGEKEEEREEGRAKEVVEKQLQEGLLGLEYNPEKLSIAYEPVWAIGTGRTPHPEDAQRMHSIIREILGKKGEEVRIMYGGSVKTNNVGDFLKQGDIDGALIGGASLDPDSFAEIIKIARGI